MRKIICFTLLICVGITISCTDDTLDPLQFNYVKKGTILALRGTQLQNLYVSGLPGSEVFPKALDGTEKFEFDAEFLAEDISSLESFDMFVIKRTKVGGVVTTQRVPLRNVPFSEFKKTDDYRNPWVSVSVDFTDILEALGLDPTDDDFATTILDLYPTGISVESDLNLADGTKVLASEIVAAGLFASGQFYPAQKLTIAVTNYCPEDIEATFDYSTVVTAVGTGGDITGCPGVVTGEGEFKSISRGKYSISDATFGQYGCAWDDDPATGVTLTNTCDKITTGGADQYDLIYTISNLVVSLDGTEMSFKWENDFGDKGTTTLKRNDTGTWPTTLFTD